MTKFNSTKRYDLAPETRDYLRDWYEWTKRGAPHREFYYTQLGLCSNLKFYPVVKSTEEENFILEDLTSIWGEENNYPFGSEDYFHRVALRSQHRCPKRLAFVRANLPR